MKTKTATPNRWCKKIVNTALKRHLRIMCLRICFHDCTLSCECRTDPILVENQNSKSNTTHCRLSEFRTSSYFLQHGFLYTFTTAGDRRQYFPAKMPTINRIIICLPFPSEHISPHHHLVTARKENQSKGEKNDRQSEKKTIT